MAAYSFDGELYLWRSHADSWVFVNLPEAVSDAIEETLPEPPRAFGAVRVDVRIGRTSWRTSIFPSKEQRTYVLPVKRPVLQAESLSPGDTATVQLSPAAQTSAASVIE